MKKKQNKKKRKQAAANEFHQKKLHKDKVMTGLHLMSQPGENNQVHSSKYFTFVPLYTSIPLLRGKY